MSARPGTPYILRAIVVNALLVVGLVQVQRNGQLNGKMIALYIGMAVVANALMYFGSRARRRLQERKGL